LNAPTLKVPTPNAPTPNARQCDLPIIAQQQNSMHMIRHDDRRIQLYVLEMLRHLLPAGLGNVSDGGNRHLSTESNGADVAQNWT